VLAGVEEGRIIVVEGVVLVGQVEMFMMLASMSFRGSSLLLEE
jgi:hypothetical protein